MIKKWICGQKSAVLTQQPRKHHNHTSSQPKRSTKQRPSSGPVRSPSSPTTTIATTTLDTSFDSGTHTPKATPKKKLDFQQHDADKELDALVASTADSKGAASHGMEKEEQDANHKDTTNNKKKKGWWCIGTSPPVERYDWVDVEHTAAIQIQKLVRYVQTRDRLELTGCTTAHMRNRIRERQANNSNPYYRRIITDDTPTFFQCCGVSLLL